ncbi:MAG TPA: phosphosulfolactate synthase [Acidimicrobiia bacterium]|nr:phosphosulfolactate synthase [Acidimicrobiia bacterium]
MNRSGALPGVPRREAVRNGPELALADFLALPERTSKPRQRGITHVIDRGLPISTLESLLDVAGAHIDFVKFGWGTAYVSRHIRAKVVACQEAKVRTCVGGTLLELATVQGKLREFVRWADSLAFDALEVSEGTVELGSGVKEGLIAAISRDFCVLAEVGSKDADEPVLPGVWAAQMVRDLDAGADFVIAEGRESGTVGLYGPDGTIRESLVGALLAGVPADRIIFEAPVSAQQKWFVRHLGVDVNLGNIAPDEVIALETLRRGLRADTAGLALHRQGSRLEGTTPSGTC